MSARDVMKVNGSNTPEEDTMLTQSYIQEQSELFEKMKKFLISQQSTLRHNLEDAREKIDKTGIQQKAGQKEGTLPQPSTSHGTQIDDVGRIQPKQNEEIQICPVCGLEFGANGNSDAFELHVEGHWCSSEFPLNS